MALLWCYYIAAQVLVFLAIKIKFKIQRTSLTKVNKSPFYQGVQLWNRLNRDVQRATTKVKFKTMLKKLGR